MCCEKKKIPFIDTPLRIYRHLEPCDCQVVFVNVPSENRPLTQRFLPMYLVVKPYQRSC